MSSIYLNVILQSDYSSVKLVCNTDFCSPSSTDFGRCLTSSTFTGTLGCDYDCYFITTKSNYMDQSSTNYRLSFFPWKPNIFLMEKGSRWITIAWSLDENTYIRSFELFVNSTYLTTIGSLERSYRYENILPNRIYTFHIKLNSNYPIESSRIDVKILEEVPERPTPYEIENQFNYNSIPYINGTYGIAWENSFYDYLATIIQINSPTKQFRKAQMVLGSEKECYYTFPCNGKLKPNTNYKILVGGCTTAGCTYVSSRSFRTKSKSTAQSFAWVAVFPCVAVLIILGLIIWKRKAMMNCCCRKINRDDSKLVHTNSYAITPTAPPLYVYTFPEMKPKLLVPYTNLTDEDKRNLTDQFQELQNLAPKYDSKSDKYTNGLYDRYNDIPSRGPWNKTAVRLTDPHRQHDYINANEIQGVDSPHQYIACQGPLKNTCEDFWDMIFQYQINRILMLSKFHQMKCYPYIPMEKNQTINFGKNRIEVKNIQYELNNQLEIRQLSVKQGMRELHVIHYWFTNWSGFDVIHSRSLFDLIEIVNRNPSVPIAIHCSSGTGRTGTYITIDIIIHLLNQPNIDLSKMKLDTMGIVNQLKHERINMVQTSEQYLFIHRCIEDYLKRIHRLMKGESNIYEQVEDQNVDLNVESYMNLRRSREISYQEIPEITTDQLNHGYYCVPIDESHHPEPLPTQQSETTQSKFIKEKF
ncbi:hypothetical protein I4U23_001398 [Adineta vaga]|nr:hypothetical protein I4U23_001398 [Adineta vaga]